MNDEQRNQEYAERDDANRRELHKRFGDRITGLFRQHLGDKAAIAEMQFWTGLQPPPVGCDSVEDWLCERAKKLIRSMDDRVT